MYFNSLNPHYRIGTLIIPIWWMKSLGYTQASDVPRIPQLEVKGPGFDSCMSSFGVKNFITYLLLECRRYTMRHKTNIDSKCEL